MKKALPFVVLFILCLSAFGQQQTATPSASPEPDNDVVRISTKLVQFDVLVVDKNGKQVRDLTAADFEILQDGKPQKITNLSYVNTEVPKTQIKSGASVSTVKTNAARIITFVVDDGSCSVSTVGLRASREGIEKFIREQMHPTDLIAIYQTRAGSSLLQQYTSDRSQLLKTVQKIQWHPPIGSCASSDGSMFEAARSNEIVKQSPIVTTTRAIESDSERAAREHIEDAQQNYSVVGSLGVLRYVIQGLRRVQGRKVVFFLSDGIPLRDRGGQMVSAADRLRDVTDLANRSSVVFNTIDSRGVIDTNPEARDEIYGQDDIHASDNSRDDRNAAVSNSRDGLAYLARETGGEFYQEQNFLDVPIGKAMASETGYYVIAYDPADDTFTGKKFNKIRVRVKRPDLKVVSRTGFLSIADEAPKTKYKSEDSELYEALRAPLPQPGLNLQLTAYYVNSADSGDMVRSLVHLDGSQITFVDDANGQKKAVFDVVAVTLDEKNQVVDEFARTHTYKVEAGAIPAIVKNGLVYSTDVPIKKAGTYNFRVAVRDAASKQLGSSSQIVEVPDLKEKLLFVSGLTLSQADASGRFAVPAAAKPDNAMTYISSGAVPAVRLFNRGSILAYAYMIYNAQLDPATGQPKLSVQTKLYHNGKAVIEGKPQDAQLEKQADWSRIRDFSYLRLTPQIEPGDYSLQLIVTDRLASGKTAVSSQSVDFTIVD